MPADGEFVYKFTEYLYKKQHFKDGVDRTSVHNYFCFQKNSEKNAFYATAVFTMNKHNDASLPYSHMYTTQHYLISPTGNYGYAITQYPYENWYRPAKGDKNDFFRARVIIITDPKKVKPIWQCSTAAKAHIHGGINGRNTFTASITQFNHILPDGSPLCQNDYYCSNLQENDCIKGSLNYSRCFQKIIEDGWEIKYDLP